MYGVCSSYFLPEKRKTFIFLFIKVRLERLAFAFSFMNVFSICDRFLNLPFYSKICVLHVGTYMSLGL